MFLVTITGYYCSEGFIVVALNGEDAKIYALVESDIVDGVKRHIEYSGYAWPWDDRHVTSDKPPETIEAFIESHVEVSELDTETEGIAGQHVYYE